MAINFPRARPRFALLVAIALTAASVFVVVIRATHAGALWRDEAGAVQVALMPSVHDVTRVFQHEAFPLLFPLALRAFAAVAGTGDAAFRMFGLLAGLALIAALWMTARIVTGTVPLLSIALLGLSPAVLVWASSVRGYGMGTVLILATVGLTWRVVTAPTLRTVGVTAIAAICSVQMLYHNAAMLFAVIIAGAAVAARNGHWKRVLLLLGIGAIAATSLVPYISVLRSADWTRIIALPDVSFSLLEMKLSGTLAWGGPVLGRVWLLLPAGAIGAAVLAQLRGSSPQEKSSRDASLYCLITLLVALPACFVFLKMLRYPPREWYYVALMGLMAVAIDGCLAAVPWQWWKKWGRAALAGVVGLVSFIPAWQMAHMRQTNIDLISAQLEKGATSGDVVVVAPWYLGVGFDRYYKGAAEWMTLPQLEDHTMHRYDLAQKQMQAINPIAPVLEAMTGALRSGHRVWLIGEFSWLRPGETPPHVDPAPDPAAGWDEATYNRVWESQATYALQTMSGARVETVPIAGDEQINEYERPGLVLVQTHFSP